MPVHVYPDHGVLDCMTNMGDSGMNNSGHTFLPAQTSAAVSSEAETLAKLDDLNSSVSRSGDRKEGLRKILAAVIALLGADKGNIQLFDAERGILSIEVHQGFERAFLDTFKRVSTVDDTACGRALRLRRPIVIEDTETDLGYARFRAAARAAGYRAVVSSPIMATPVLPLGMISVHFASPISPQTRTSASCLSTSVLPPTSFKEVKRKGAARRVKAFPSNSASGKCEQPLRDRRTRRKLVAQLAA